MSSVHEYSVLIRELHLDTFGHVNNAVYLSLFEEARWDLVTANGYGLQRVHELQQGPVILDVTLKFLKELKLREQIKILTQLESYKGKIGVLKQQMLTSQGELACEARFTMGLFDLKLRKLIPPSADWSRAVGLTENTPG